MINKVALERIHGFVEIGQKEGARLLIGGGKADVGGKGFFYLPTLFDGVLPGTTLEREEVFGPVLSIIEVEFTGGSHRSQ